jgi:hypothetical protein
LLRPANRKSLRTTTEPVKQLVLDPANRIIGYITGTAELPTLRTGQLHEPFGLPWNRKLPGAKPAVSLISLAPQRFILAVDGDLSRVDLTLSKPDKVIGTLPAGTQWLEHGHSHGDELTLLAGLGDKTITTVEIYDEQLLQSTEAAVAAVGVKPGLRAMTLARSDWVAYANSEQPLTLRTLGPRLSEDLPLGAQVYSVAWLDEKASDWAAGCGDGWVRCSKKTFDFKFYDKTEYAIYAASWLLSDKQLFILDGIQWQRLKRVNDHWEFPKAFDFPGMSCLAMHGDGKLMATGYVDSSKSEDGIAIWKTDATSPIPQKTIPLKDRIFDIAAGPGSSEPGRTLLKEYYATIDQARTLRLRRWDTDLAGEADPPAGWTVTVPAEPQEDPELNALAWSVDGMRIAVADGAGKIMIYRVVLRP